MDRRRSHPQFRIQEARWELNGGKGTLQSHKVGHQAGLRGWSTSAPKFWLKKMARRVLITTFLADPQHDEADPPVQAIPVNPVRRVIGTFAQSDGVDLTEEFERRTRIMRTVPFVMTGAYREAMRVALDRHTATGERVEVVYSPPRLLLFRPGRGGLVPKRKLEERTNRFAAGHWLSSQQVPHAGEDATKVTRRRHYEQNDWRLWVNCLPHGELSKEQRLH